MPMSVQTLEGHLGVSIEIDLCVPCQAFWFDNRESLQLTPRSTLKLFRVIGEEVGAGRRALSATAKCPRCGSRLIPTHDMQRNVGVRVRSLQPRPRTVDDVLRLPAGKELHSAALGGPDRRAPPQRRRRSTARTAALRSISPRTGPARIAVRRSPCSTCGRPRNSSPSCSGPTAPIDRSIRRCRCASSRPGARSRRRLPRSSTSPAGSTLSRRQGS